MGMSPALSFPTTPRGYPTYPTTQYGGQNQYMSFPSLPSPSPSGPGIVPPAAGPAPSTAEPSGSSIQSWTKLGGGAYTGGPLDPQLTSALFNYLQGQVGQGVTPFNLSASLPSGGTTAPGTLTAPMNPLMQALNQFYAGQGGGPNSFILPMWQSQMAAMQQPIQENLANLKEQFGAQGALGSSEMAKAMQDYLTQTTLQQQSLLGQETLSALPGMQSEAAATQQLDQSSIQNLLQEFMRTQPQYNPLLQEMFGGSTTFPPMYTAKGGVGQALIGSAGGAMSGLANLIPAIAGL
jgi:hypothetical protein